MNIKIKTFLFLIFISLMSSCSHEDTPEPETPIEIAGNWFFTMAFDFSQCNSLQSYQSVFSVTIEQTNELKIISPFGTFMGSIDNDNLTWSGQYLDEHLGKYLSYSGVNVTVNDQSLSGTGTLQVRDSIAGNLVCQGVFTLTGSQILDSGEAPVAPQIKEFVAEEVAGTTVKLRWIDRSINENGFIVERSLSETENFVVVYQALANQESFDDSGLTANTIYFYRVKARNNFGDSEYSDVLSVTTNNPSAYVPLPPTELSSSNIQTSSVDLNWVDNSDNETGFNVERSTDLGQSFVKIGETVNDVTTFSDSALEAFTEYHYQVRAFNSAGNGDYSNILEVTTLDIFPSAPTMLVTTTKTNNSIQITWVDNSVNEQSFIIERSVFSDSGFTEIATLGVDTTSFQDTLLLAQTNYFYRVKASNSAGESDYSNILNVTTNAQATQLPLTPTGFSLVASKTNLVFILTWNDVINESNYEIQRKTAITNFENIATIGSDAETYTDTNISNPDTEYFYRIRATNSAGASAYTDYLSSISAHNADPVINLQTSVAVNGQSVILSWTNPDNILSIEVQRSDIAEIGPYSTLVTLAVDEVTYQDTSVEIDTTYYYKVVTINDLASASVTTSVTTSSPPLPPQNLNVVTQADASSVTVSWDTSDNALSYRVERSTSSTSGFADISGQLAATELSFVDSTVNHSTTYYYNVYAINAVGESFTQGTTTTPSPPAPVTGVILTPNVFNTTALLSWDDVSNETSYQIEYGSTSTGNLSRVTLGANVVNYTMNGLIPNTQYRVHIRVTNAVGASLYTPFQTFQSARAADAVGSFTGVSTTNGSEVNLSWTTQSNASTYNIQRSSSATTGYTDLVLGISGATGSYSDSNVTPGLTYYYRIQSINSVGSSSYVYSGVVIVNNVPVSPAAPSNLSVTFKVGGTLTSITATWVDNALNESGYRIYAVSVPSLITRRNYVLVDGTIPANSQQFIIDVPTSGVPASGYYCFKIEAYNLGGTSSDEYCIAL